MSRGQYVAINRRTGARKYFDTYDLMQAWYITLSIQDSLDWSSWDFIY